MKFFVVPTVLTAVCIGLSSCAIFQSGEQAQSDPVIGEVAGESITLSELESNFYQSSSTENQPEADSEDENLSQFLDLYLDYKAKLAVARDAGYYEDEELQKELAEYEKQSAYPYWLENRVRDELLHELAERFEEQIHVSHILIGLSPEAPPRDTLAAYESLMDARERFYAGESFADLSEEISTRQRGQSLGGDLGYFSGGWSVKPFEDMAYNTPVDSVSKPFRTQYGYHVIYVKDRMPRQAERNISHIFLQTNDGSYTEDSALAAAEDIYQELEQGTNWNHLVNEHTQDLESRERGGDIGWVTTGRYNQEFTQAAMSLNETGTYHKPFYSGYGVHILRLDSIKQQADPEDKRDELLERLKQLPRYRENSEAVLKAVRKVGDEKIHRETLNAFEDHVQASGQSFNTIEWPDALKEQPLYTINEHNYTAGDYVEWLKNRQQDRYQHHVLDQFVNESADKQVVALTKQEFPDFRDISENYIHGLAVFKVSEDSVWNYAQNDTASLKAIYEANQDDYTYGKRYQYVRLSADEDSTLNKAINTIYSGISLDSLINSIQGLVVRRDIINNLEEDPFDKLTGLSDGEFTEYFDYSNRRTTLLLEEIQLPRTMTFDEAYNKLVAQYQPIREKSWMEEIRRTYSVQPYHEKLISIKEK
ncbi:MAG: peptidylprolyl isomerase [Balneolales bacterium]